MKDGADEDAAASDLGDSIISDSEPGIADKRQLNLNHEYERSERGREYARARGREGKRKGGREDREGGRERKRQTREERQPEPRRQSDGSFVTVMASTPGLQPPRGLHPFSFTGEHAETQTPTRGHACVYPVPHVINP